MLYRGYTGVVKRKLSRSGYLFWLYLLIPLDWFGPTAFLFREFGAKPANILLTIVGIYALFRLKSISLVQDRLERRAFLLLFSIFCINLISFGISCAFGWSDVPNLHNPFIQFFTQSLMIITASLSLVGNSRFFSRLDIEENLFWVLPRVAAIHLMIWSLEAFFPEFVRPFLLPFRNGDSFERASGLMSEPSYYGTMAALYAIPLLLAPHYRQNWFVKFIAICLLASSVFVTAKTMIIVAGTQILFLILVNKRDKIMSICSLLCLGACAVYFLQTKAMVDVEENLSSAMRLGSAHLAMNVALSGVALVGIGAGQFHFHYTSQNAPDYLMFSTEAIEQMSPNIATRASTYNFPLRVLIELGVVGFLLLAFGLISLIRRNDEKSRISQLLFIGSLGFLLTQDTYFYPPLITAGALLMASRQQ